MEPPSSLPGHAAGDGDDVLEVTVLADGQRVRIAGEVDMSTLHRLRAGLSGLPPACGEVLHLHLAGLRFIDVAGARELVLLAQRRARRLVLHDPPRTLRRLIFLIWPDATVEIRTSAPRPDPSGRWPGRPAPAAPAPPRPGGNWPGHSRPGHTGPGHPEPGHPGPPGT